MSVPETVENQGILNEIKEVLLKNEELTTSNPKEGLKNILEGMTTLVSEHMPMRTVSTASVVKSRKTVAEMPTNLESAGTGAGVKVTLSMGLTRNLGDFNSARFDVSAETYYDDTDKGFDEAMSRLKSRAEKEVQKQQEDVVAYLDSKKGKK